MNLATADLLQAEIARLHGVNERLRAEIERLRLTDAERDAVEASREFWQVEADAFAEPTDQQYAATLRGLLERLK